jgi:hypothetical protein
MIVVERPVERRITILIMRADVGTVVDKQPYRFKITLACRPHQGGMAVVGRCPHIGAIGQQHIDNGVMAQIGGDH